MLDGVEDSTFPETSRGFGLVFSPEKLPRSNGITGAMTGNVIGVDVDLGVNDMYGVGSIGFNVSVDPCRKSFEWPKSRAAELTTVAFDCTIEFG